MLGGLLGGRSVRRVVTRKSLLAGGGVRGLLGGKVLEGLLGGEIVEEGEGVRSG